MMNLVINKLISITSFIGVILMLNQSCLGQGSMIEKFIFSDKSYAKHVEIKFYVVTAEFAAKLILLESPPSEIEPLAYNTAKDKEIFAFIALKNNGNKSPWGSLIFDSIGRKRKISVSFISRNSWTYFVIPVGKIQNEQDIELLQKAKLKWEKLYSK